MARLKHSYDANRLAVKRRLAGGIRDGAIETPGALEFAGLRLPWLAGGIRDGAIKT